MRPKLLHESLVQSLQHVLPDEEDEADEIGSLSQSAEAMRLSAAAPARSTPWAATTTADRLYRDHQGAAPRGARPFVCRPAPRCAGSLAGSGMDEIEAIGGLAEGGLIARAVEPKAGEASEADGGHTQETACLNCGTPLAGPHCHGCGQHAHVHRTIGASCTTCSTARCISRARPGTRCRAGDGGRGQLTRRYIDGERARFVSPMALFLFSVFLMFAVFQRVGTRRRRSRAGDVQMAERGGRRTNGARRSSNRAAHGSASPWRTAIRAPADRCGQIAAIERQLEETASSDGKVGGAATRPAATMAVRTPGSPPEPTGSPGSTRHREVAAEPHADGLQAAVRTSTSSRGC